MHHVLFAGFAIAYGLAALSLLAGLLRAASAAASQVPDAQTVPHHQSLSP